MEVEYDTGEVTESNKVDRLAELKQRIQEKKKSLLSTKLSKRVLGTDKKLRSQIERLELKHKANEKFVSYYDSLTMNHTGYSFVMKED